MVKVVDGADLVESFEQKVTTAEFETAAEPIQEQKVTATAEPETADPEEPVEVARDRLRSVAKVKGVLWLRPILETRNVARLSELSDQQVRELLCIAGDEPA